VLRRLQTSRPPVSVRRKSTGREGVLHEGVSAHIPLAGAASDNGRTFVNGVNIRGAARGAKLSPTGRFEICYLLDINLFFCSSVFIIIFLRIIMTLKA